MLPRSNMIRVPYFKFFFIIDTFYKVDVLLLNPIAPPAGPCAPDAAFPGKTAATQSRITGLKARLKDFQSDKVYLT